MTCNHEWGGVVIPGPVNRVVIDQCENCGEFRLPDAAPSAQAVDLGQFRRLIVKYRDSLTHRRYDAKEIAECNRLLALTKESPNAP